MAELVEFIVKSIVSHPEEVSVQLLEGAGGASTIEVRVAPGDMGKIIGKQGKIAKAIRTVVKASAYENSQKTNVEIL